MDRILKGATALAGGVLMSAATAGAALAGSLSFNAGGVTYTAPVLTGSVKAVYQNGATPTATVNQNATVNIAGVTQIGFGPAKAVVTQTGHANASTVIQVTSPFSLLGQ